MLASIHPLGERARGNSFVVSAVAYAAGSVAAASALGGLLGRLGALTLGRLDADARLVVLAVTALLAAAADHAVARIPSWRRQVNEDWLAGYRGWVYALGFGFQLGLGVVTIVTTASVYLTWIGALLAASAGAGAVVGAAFGLARAGPVLLGGRLRTPAAVGARGRRWASVAGRFRVVTVLAELAAAGALVILVGR